jgi:hypothetical protein
MHVSVLVPSPANVESISSRPESVRSRAPFLVSSAEGSPRRSDDDDDVGARTSGGIVATHFRGSVHLACRPNCHFFIVLVSTKHCPPAHLSRLSPTVLFLSLSHSLFFSPSRPLNVLLALSVSVSSSLSFLSPFRHLHSLFVHRTPIFACATEPSRSFSLSRSACAIYFSSLSLATSASPFHLRRALPRCPNASTPYCHAGAGRVRYCQSRALPAAQVEPPDISRPGKGCRTAADSRVLFHPPGGI